MNVMGTQARSRPRQRVRLAAVAVAGVVAMLLPTAAQAAEPGTWTSTGSFVDSRYQHVSSRLADGRVLITGGLTAWVTKDGFVRRDVLASTELYDPATGSWKRTGAMSEARHHTTATTLEDGRVLVTGGRSGGRELSSTEIFNPTTGKWSAGASTTFARTEHLAVRLADGRVLVAGQRNVSVEGDREPTAEIYDPETDTWATTGPTGAHSGCCNPQGVLLPDGRVLTTLGTSSQWDLNGGGPTIYDPATDTWSRLPAAPAFLGNGPQIALLPSGNVLFAGGWASDFWAGTWPTNVVAELDPATGTWTSRPDSDFRNFLSSQSLTTLDDGRVLASGGGGPSDVDHVYDPATATWTTVAGVNRAKATVTLLSDGRALTAGGYPNASQSSSLPTAEVFQP